MVDILRETLDCKSLEARVQAQCPVRTVVRFPHDPKSPPKGSKEALERHRKAEETKKRGGKPLSLASLTRRLDEVFSEFIRRRDCDRHTGMSWCRTCGAPGRWQDLQCGHWIKRHFLGTRWREENCHTQCGTCNGVRRGAEHEHASHIAKTYGAGMLEELLAAKRGVHRLSRSSMLELIDHYKARLEMLV